tara:strand:- start:2650 stop:3054 length:405 start_codon:yes stop_codon:yes gene_type:complete
MIIKIRPAVKNDIADILFILKDAFGSPTLVTTNDEYFDDINILTFVGEFEGTIIGTATLHIIKKINRKVGLIEDVAVMPLYKKKGFGKLLLEHLIKLAKSKGVYKTMLNSDLKNEIFYHKIGFKTEQIQLVKRY